MAHASCENGVITVSIHGKESTLRLEAAKDLWHELGVALNEAEAYHDPGTASGKSVEEVVIASPGPPPSDEAGTTPHPDEVTPTIPLEPGIDVVPPAPEPQPDDEDLESLTKAQLQERAQAEGISFEHGWHKGTLVHILAGQFDEMSKQNLKDYLERQGVDVPSGASKADLVALAEE